MISFENFKMTDDSPIYLQIVRFIKREIVAGNILSQEEMPSRRVLSALLSVNPNTIQKACVLLEEEGIIVSHAGAKSYVEVDERKVSDIRRELITRETAIWIGALRQMGITREEAVGVLEQMWEEE